MGLALRPVLIVPMAPSGPLGGSELLPAAVVVLIGGSIMLAAGVLIGNRPMTALAILTAVAAPFLAVVGAIAGLPMPWPLLLAIYDIALAAIGIAAWRAPRTA